MRIGHLTLMHGYNFGGALQALATQKILAQYGHEVVTLDYHPSRRYRFLRSLTRNGRYIDRHLRMWIDGRRYSGVSEFDAFREQWFKFGLPCDGNRRLARVCRSLKLDAVAVGSDQVWNPNWLRSPYFIDFDLDDGVKRIALAACSGFLPDDPAFLRYCGRTLARFDHVSTRNDFTDALVAKATGRRSTVTCDPTLVVDLPREAYHAVRHPYALVYVLNRRGTSEALAGRAIAELKARWRGLQICSITPPELRGVETMMVDETVHDISPLQWHWLVANADWVVTDSFHGTLFSLKHQRKAIIVAAGSRPVQRIESVLRDLSASSLLVRSETDIREAIAFSQSIDREAIDQRIRMKALAYRAFVSSL